MYRQLYSLYTCTHIRPDPCNSQFCESAARNLEREGQIFRRLCPFFGEFMLDFNFGGYVQVLGSLCKQEYIALSKSCHKQCMQSPGTQAKKINLHTLQAGRGPGRNCLNVYVGETTKNLYTRAGEHLAVYQAKLNGGKKESFKYKQEKHRAAGSSP